MVVHDFSVFIDVDLSMKTHVMTSAHVCLLCFGKPAQKYPSIGVTLVVSLDYDNTTLAGIPSQQLKQLQSVVNRATVFCMPRNFEPSCGICPLLRNFNISTEFHGILEMTGDY